MDKEILISETKKLLKMIGISYKEVFVSDDRDLRITIVSIRVSGPEQELFLKENKQVSRDFSYLLKLLLQKKHHSYKNLIIDVNGEEKRFIELAKQKAQIAAERVEFFDKPYEFGYLNAYERMLIHSYLKSFSGLITESFGEGKERRLVIRKKTS